MEQPEFVHCGIRVFRAIRQRGYFLGTEYTQEQINAALSEQVKARQEQIVPSRDISGHGTSVAGVAAGNGRGSVGGIYMGVAPQSELLIVKLGIRDREGFREQQS